MTTVGGAAARRVLVVDDGRVIRSVIAVREIPAGRRVERRPGRGRPEPHGH